MENIGIILNQIKLMLDDGQFAQGSVVYASYPGARKEFEALKSAGVEVKIEQVEHVTIVKPKSKRGSYRPRTKKSSQTE